VRNIWAWLNSKTAAFKAIAAAIAAIIATAASLIAILDPFGVLRSDNSEDGLAASRALQAAVSRVHDAGSSRVAIRAKTLRSARSDTTGSGVFDYRRGVGRLTVRREGAVRAITIYDGDTTYARLLEFDRDRWLKFTKQPGFEGGLSGLFLAPDPSQQLEYLRDLVNPKKVSQQNVFGSPTTRYVAERTLEQLPPKPTVPANANAKLRRAITQRWPVARRSLDGAGETIDAWIDANGLVRQIQVTTCARAFSVRYVVNLYDFGVPVHVRPPRHT
jgi:hypothetical protein